jgi:hypothetical protein
VNAAQKERKGGHELSDTTKDATWLVEYRMRSPTITRPLSWRDYCTTEVAAPTRAKALVAWRSRHGGDGRQVLSLRVGAASTPRRTGYS